MEHLGGIGPWPPLFDLKFLIFYELSTGGNPCFFRNLQTKGIIEAGNPHGN